MTKQWLSTCPVLLDMNRDELRRLARSTTDDDDAQQLMDDVEKKLKDLQAQATQAYSDFLGLRPKRKQ